MKKIFALLLCALCVAPLVAAQPLTRVAPQKVGIDPERMLNADRIINDAVNNQEIPGAVLAVVKDGKMAYLKAYGNRRIVPDHLRYGFVQQVARHCRVLYDSHREGLCAPTRCCEHLHPWVLRLDIDRWQKQINHSH